MIEKDYTQQIEESVRDLFFNMSQRVSAEDMARVRSAYELAKDAHKNQRRKSGEPYIIHPIAVARIVAEELELGANPVIAAFLHDVVEDTNHTIEEVREQFGKDVSFLVAVVTKQKKESYVLSKQVDNYRQILASVQFDIRAILLKLADRLHNMRTLESMRPDKQMKIAGETDYFYAPLANRLGLYHIKAELENLSFRYRCPKEYSTIEKLLNKEKAENKENITAFTKRVNELLRKVGAKVTTEVRYRTPYSIWRKMQAAGCDFNHIDGKHYIRVIYSLDSNYISVMNSGNEEAAVLKLKELEKRESLRIYATLTDTLKEKPGSVTNYIDTPKENGYQSFHVKLLSDKGHWEEIHISSSRMVRNSRLGCSAERTEENVLSWIGKFKAVLHDVADHTHGIDFMDDVTSSFYYDDINVYTPKGRNIILPKGATALDFAFDLHSEIGKHAVYARINGKLMSVKSKLHRGDCVEIGTDENAFPESDWLDYVMTYKAKKALRSYFQDQPELEYNLCPVCKPLPGDEVIGFQSGNEKITLHKRNCYVAIREASQNGDKIVSVNFNENESFLYPVRIRIRALDRNHLLRDVVACITEKQKLSMTSLTMVTTDRIVESTIDFMIHSMTELDAAIKSISMIDDVDEVQRLEIK